MAIMRLHISIRLLLSITLALLLFFSFVTSYEILHPRRAVPPITPQTLGYKYRNVSLNSEGVNLHGWFIYSANHTDKTVLVAHGLHMDKTFFIKLIGPLRESYNVFLFDFRGHGLSGGHSTLGYKEKNDILAAVDWLDDQDQKVYAIGVSMGASALIMAAAEDNHIKGVVADSPFAYLGGLSDSEFHSALNLPSFPFKYLIAFFLEMQGVPIAKINPSRVIHHISPRPILIIHSRNDELLETRNAMELYESAGEPKYLWITNASAHGTTALEYKYEYLKRVREIFK